MFHTFNIGKRKKKLIVASLVLFVIAGIYLTLPGRDFPTAVPVFQEEKKVPIYYVETDANKIAISFDAAWGAAYTGKLLEILEEFDIKTTFFLTGFWIENYPQKVEEIAEKGHEVENHSYSHSHMSNFSKNQIEEDVKKVHEQIEEITGKEPQLFRPPFGDYNNRLIETLEEMDYYPIQWSIDSLDWQAPDYEYIVDNVTDEIHPGAIVLFHNNATHTPEALRTILEELEKEEYEVVPVSELIYKDNYTVDPNTGAQEKFED